MQIATHFYAYKVRLERHHARLGNTATGRLQTAQGVTTEAALRLIDEMSHHALGPFELVELTLLRHTPVPTH